MEYKVKNLLPVAQVPYPLQQQTASLTELEASGLKTQSYWVTLCSRTGCPKWKSSKVSFSPFYCQSLLWIDGKFVLFLFMCILFPKFFCMKQTHIKTHSDILLCPERSQAKDGNEKWPLRKRERNALSGWHPKATHTLPHLVWG